MAKKTSKLDWVIHQLLQIKNKKDLRDFLTDILSPGEIDDIYDRLQIIQELALHKTPHREVSKKMEVSISKVTRAAHVVKYGSGFFTKFFSKRKSSKK